MMCCARQLSLLLWITARKWSVSDILQGDSMTLTGADLCIHMQRIAAETMLRLTCLNFFEHGLGGTSDSRYGNSHRQRPSATQVTSASRLRTISTPKMRHSSVIDRYTAASFTLRRAPGVSRRARRF